MSRVAACLVACWVVSFTLAPAPLRAQDEEGSPEERLLEAELLEVSSGDLDGAMAVYRALAGDEDVPRRVRDRARLALARTLRKRGDLEAARRVLEELTGAEGTDPAVTRRAGGFLDELERGESASPRFDWIGELRKSPEIQARIFDYIMDLVESGDRAQTAARQLLALGTITRPALEQAAETSRDADHRRRLALLLCHMGRFEFLERAIASTGHRDVDHYLVYSLAEEVRRLEGERRDAFAEALEALDPSRVDRRLVALLELQAGVSVDLAVALARVEPWWARGGFSFVFPDIQERLARSVPGCRALLARVFSGEPDQDLAIDYLRLALEHHPGLVEPRHVAAVLARWEGAAPDDLALRAIGHVERRGGLDALLDALGDESARADDLLRRYFVENYVRARLDEAPAGWARFLARTDFDRLRHLAERNDAAVGVFVDELVRPDLAFEGSWKRRDAGTWVPSKAYLEGMGRVLETPDVTAAALGIALEALALAPAGAGPDVLAERDLERLALEHADWHVREMALYAALRRFGTRPETGPRVARLLARDHAARPGEKLPGSYFTSPLAEAPTRGHVETGRTFTLVRFRRRSREALRRMESGGRAFDDDDIPVPYEEDSMAWIPENLGSELLRRLHAHLLAVTGTEDGTGGYRWLAGEVEGGFVEALVEDLPATEAEGAVAFGVGRLRALVYGQRGDRSAAAELVAGSGELLDFLRGIARDSERPPRLRADAIVAGGKDAGEWFDWPELVRSGDPVLEPLRHRFWYRLRKLHDVLEYLPRLDDDASIDVEAVREIVEEAMFSPEAYREVVIASLECPLASWRQEGLGRLEEVVDNWQAYVEHLGKLAGDPDDDVFKKVVVELLDTGDARALPLIEHHLAARPDFDWSEAWNGAYERDVVRAVRTWPGATAPDLASTLFEAPSPRVRQLALRVDLLDARSVPLELLARALEDPAQSIREAALRRLVVMRQRPAGQLELLVQRDDAAELLLQVARSDVWSPGDRELAIRGLEELALPETIEPLAGLLEAPNAAVRNAALEALEGIRQTIERRREWKQVLEELRAGRAPDGSEKSDAPNGPEGADGGAPPGGGDGTGGEKGRDAGT